VKVSETVTIVEYLDILQETVGIGDLWNKEEVWNIGEIDKIRVI